MVVDPDPPATLVTDWRIAATTPEGETHLFYITAYDHATWRIAQLDPDEAATHPDGEHP
ncbi:MAG TPA: hypothetical protein VGN33_14180 [Leifsonia sp.]|nr:hypothetical protein [Leifsonia sp.]